MNAFNDGLFSLSFVYFESVFSLILIRSAEASAASARQTCPICRSEINVDGDFVLAEAPETDALKKAIKESILEIPKDGKKYE